MGNSKMKNMCELEKYVEETARKKLMFCKGFYLSTGVPFYDYYFGYKPCTECKKCKQYLYRKQYVNLFYAAMVSFGISAILILGTPQGAIRRNLFFQAGIQEAFFCNVERMEEEDDTRKLHYSVVVNGQQQEWEVICLQFTCFARCLNE